MKTIFVALSLLTFLTFPGFGQKLLGAGGYTRVGEKSFTGAPAAGVHVVLPLGRRLVVGIGSTIARNHQPYQEFVPDFDFTGGGRTITEYHNFLYSIQVLLAPRLKLGPRLEAVLGPSAGLYVVGSRERTDEVRAGFGLWSGLTYQQLWGSRFNLEVLFHPRMLRPNLQVEDASFRFDGQQLFVWDAQLGISYNLRKQP
ncbi:hypothetical protein [Hymenobacter glacieicola]|uniref:Outer membrane protein beta-barrel domain-containing protein n=1 Tax=Hymenobacter glacieicola TaxID=1562124 RepID=A0ABQ1X3M9_9BACT|nr:hypothetical protein [Hymenobacter glacieicola]GGG54516.1 hypothetical protein GCM10011378_33380 [Hymenobacter glacieicola]